MGKLDDILDDFGHEVVNQPEIGRAVLLITPKQEVKALMLEILEPLDDNRITHIDTMRLLVADI